MPKTCKCGAEFEPINYPNSKVKTKECIKCLVKKGKQKTDKQWKQEKKKIKEKLKTLSDYEAEARAVFQKWVRLRDEKEGCISCGTSTSQIWDAGHWLKAELYSGLIFHEDNVHKQCRKCNHFLGGNELSYMAGLIRKIGYERVKWLNDNKDRLRTYKYTREELINIKKQYTEKIKLYEKNS